MNTLFHSPRKWPAPTARLVAGLALAVLMISPLTGCRSSGPVSAAPDIAGEYRLVQVNGQDLPCPLTHGRTAMVIQSGTFTIRADGTCRSLMNFSVPPRENLRREVGATYTRQGNQLAMKWERAGTTLGLAEGSRFTMTNEGTVFSYQR